MKILKWFLGILVCLLIAFLLAGVIQPEIHYTTSVTVDRPVRQCFRAYHDITRMSEWLEGFEKIRLTKGKPFEPGSEYEVIMQMDGEQMVMQEVITAYTKNSLFAFTLDNEVIHSETEVYFREVEGQTEITTRNKVKGKNAFWRSVFVLMQGQFEKNGQHIYENLKKVIEAS